MACLLVGQPIDDAVTELEVLVRRNGVQILDADRRLYGAAAAFETQLDVVPHVVVEKRGQRHKCRDQLVVDSDQDIAGCEHFGRRRPRYDLLDGQHAGLLRKRFARQPLGCLGQPEATQLVVGLAAEHGLQRAPGHGLPSLQFFEGAFDAIQRQEETAGRRIVGAGVQRHHLALDVDDGRSRGAARCA